MTMELRTRRVVVRCAGAPPADRVRRASGVSDVEVADHLLRCRVTGSFQPFLEALLGSEVVDLRTEDDEQARPRPTGTPVGYRETEEP